MQSPSAHGAATLYKFRGRNLVTRQKTDFVLKGTDSLPQADFHKRAVTLMYADADQVHLLDQTDFNQYSLPREDMAEDLPYITESLQGMVALIYNGECVGVQLPAAVELKITRLRSRRPRQFGDRPDQARHAGNRTSHPSAGVPEGGRNRQGGYADGRIPLAGVKNRRVTPTTATK